MIRPINSLPAAARTAAALGDIQGGIERWFESVQSQRLPNGLEVLVAPDQRSPLVATALAYRAGTRDEESGLGGTAHFLEHMMFKGSERYPAGEIDRRTQAIGGVNNAFTSHDSTLYYFTFAADRWHLALDIEADRMRGLRLEEEEVDSERQVIHEEISMYEGEPWDMLLQAAQAACFPKHPYGRPVLGTRPELDAIAGPELAAFHGRFYQPHNATLVVVGDVEPGAAFDAVNAAFGPLGSAIPDKPLRSRHQPATWSSAWRRDPLRIERHQGELARLEIALPSPPVSDPDFAALRLLCAVLSLGRSSRLHGHLVDGEQLALWVSADCQETLDPGLLSVTTELVPGADAARLESEILGALEELTRQPPSDAELERVRQVMLSDWLFGHERLDQRAFLLGGAAAHGDLQLPSRSLTRALSVTPDELRDIARRYFATDRAVIAWSWPQNERPS